jgi:hypothetical protein
MIEEVVYNWEKFSKEFPPLKLMGTMCLKSKETQKMLLQRIHYKKLGVALNLTNAILTLNKHGVPHSNINPMNVLV